MQKEERLKHKSKFGRIFIPYLKKHFVIVGIVGYYIVGLSLYIFAEIDILIPCIWYTLFDIKCPGCGLTRAFMLLLQFDFTGAWASNPLIFIVFPGLTFYIIKDFTKFVKDNK